MTPRERFQKIVGDTDFPAFIPYDHVFLTDFGLGGAVTLCHRSPKWPALYAISWQAGMQTTRAPADHPATLIHDLSHVWHGENGVAPGLYMALDGTIGRSQSLTRRKLAQPVSTLVRWR